MQDGPRRVGRRDSAALPGAGADLHGAARPAVGGLLGGRGTAAFGSHSASVLTKATAVFVALFFVIALALAVMNKKPKVSSDMSDTSSRIENTSAETESVENSEVPASDSEDKWYNN